MEHKTGNKLDPEAIIKAFEDQKPQLRNGVDAISLVLHLVMKNLGFIFLGCGDSNDEGANKDSLVPEGWNSSADSYSFRYKHPQSSMTFVIKNLVLGETLLVHGLALEDKKVQTLELNVSDFVRDGVPLNDYRNLFKDLNKLISLFVINIVNKMFPGITKEGYEHSAQTQPVQQPIHQHPLRDDRPAYDPYNDPLRVPHSGRGPRNPLMEGGPYYGQPYQPPFGVGSGDLSPFPRHPIPFGDSDTRGNLVGPHHPGFGPSVTDPYGGNRGRGAFPPPPPGARFDPYGPPRGGGNPTGFGEPDRDDMPPPGGPNYDYFL